MQKPKMRWCRTMNMWLCYGAGLYTYEHSTTAALARWTYFQNVLEKLHK